MRLPATLPARFLRRPHRFLVEADAGGRRLGCFCPNPGRLRELLVPGAGLRVAPRAAPGRRTAHDAMLVRHGRAWVGLDTRLAAAAFGEAVMAGRVEGLAGPLEAEVPVGRSRLDFRAAQGGLVEVKCASLVAGHRAWFPDAPSARATRHALALAREARRGRQATMAFVVVRPDAQALAPHAAADPVLARALAHAARAGVRLRAFRCATSPREVALASEVPVDLSAGPGPGPGGPAPPPPGF